jgi:D-alanyl-D-alanine carboxypeptidase
MKPTLPPLRRYLAPLPLLACLAIAACSPTNPGSPGPGSSPPASGSGATAVKSGTSRAQAATPPQAATPAQGMTQAQGAPEVQGTTADPAGTQTQAAAPKFRGSIATGRDAVRSRVRYSWRRGCPVGPVELRLLRADYWGFDGRVHRGELIVHRDSARRMLGVLGKLFRARFKMQRMKLVDVYRADDDRSMAANNTSAFNCRRVSGSSSWSEHAFGRAIDINPVRNPYVTRGGRVSPPAGRAYVNRAGRAAGMIYAGDVVVRAFAAAGWRWGGHWSSSRDYQHFSATGR